MIRFPLKLLFQNTTKKRKTIFLIDTSKLPSFLVIKSLAIPIMSSSMFIQQNKQPKRLTLDKIGQLEEELEENPLDYLKWNKLIEQVINKDNQEQVRNIYSKYLSIFKHDVCVNSPMVVVVYI